MHKPKWRKPSRANTMKKLMMMLALAPMLATTHAGDSNWSMGSPDGSWSMGSPDGSWPMNGRQAAHEAAIANHRIMIGFSFDEVRRAIGYPTRNNRTVTADNVRDFWYYESGTDRLTIVFEDGRVAMISN
jgi:hypothetical protein